MTTLPAEADNFIKEYLEIKSLEDELKKQKALAENKLKAILGENECALSSSGFDAASPASAVLHKYSISIDEYKQIIEHNSAFNFGICGCCSYSEVTL